MMTISRGRYLLNILFFLTNSACLHGQVKDFQSWWELEIEKKITRKLDLSAELEQRFKNNSLEYSKSLLTLGASYGLTDYLDFAGGGRMVLAKDGEKEFHPRFRIHLEGTGSHVLYGFDLSLRARMQYGFDEFLRLPYFGVNELVNRNRFKVARHISGTRFGWFASAESWHGSGNDSRWITFAMRYAAGIRFSPTFTSRFSLRYILEDEFNVVNPKQLHVLVLAYNFRF